MDESPLSDQALVEKSGLDVGDLGAALPDQPDITSDGYVIVSPRADTSC